MPILEHLFLIGEYPERSRLLSGLSLEQVTVVPPGATHSIYEELWHVVAYQESVVGSGDPDGDRFPSAPPANEQEWLELVQKFLDGGRVAAELGNEPERLAAELEPGLTLGDELNCVAIHNAYHLGKIVSMRQQMGIWPPEGANRS